MAKPQFSDGLRDLSLVRASGSTARVLNLALIYERFGKSEEFNAKPLFRSSRLNRALIIKHAVRPHERALFDYPEPHTTKIVFPYSPVELELGGTSLLFGEKRFDDQLRKAIGDGANEKEFFADHELLCVLHDLPSFDPFLLREQLRRLGREPARCFFNISEADVAAMIAFVGAEIEPLVSLAFGAGGRRAGALAKRLAEKLMTDENARLLEPLRETLRLTPAQYGEGVFAWKGFLYYKWMLVDFRARHLAFVNSLRACAISGADRASRVEFERLRADALGRLELALTRTYEAMGEYRDAFAALTRGEAADFRAFLLDAPARFVPLGEALGAIKHVHSLWGYRFPAGTAPRLDAEEASEILGEFDRMLASLDLVRESAVGELMI